MGVCDRLRWRRGRKNRKRKWERERERERVLLSHEWRAQPICEPTSLWYYLGGKLRVFVLPTSRSFDSTVLAPPRLLLWWNSLDPSGGFLLFHPPDLRIILHPLHKPIRRADKSRAPLTDVFWFIYSFELSDVGYLSKKEKLDLDREGGCRRWCKRENI